MGLFDDVSVYSPLLAEELRSVRWQTKDLECGMDHYTITADGRLIHTITVLEPVPEEQRPYWNKPEWADPFCQAFGSLRAVPVRDEELPYHGEICFYGHDRDRVFREFTAHFTDGRLSWIREEEVPLPAAPAVKPGAPPSP